ncbi:MAG TPA: AI-2E family transporter [Geminicoccaceae bacterium]|nr:AI-2E family transporter [Geminicoccaceae bacterium]
MAQRVVSGPSPADDAAPPAETPEWQESVLSLGTGWGRAATVGVVGLFILGVFYTLYFAKSFFIPVAVAVLLNLLLSPVVRRLARLGVPEGLGAALVLLAALAVVGFAVLRLAAPAAEWLERAPLSIWQVQYKLSALMESVEEMRKATRELEELAQVGAQEQGAEESQTVVVEGPGLIQSVLAGTTSFVTSAFITIILLYFLLASGDLFLAKIVRVLPRLTDKKRAVEIARQAERDISRYLTTVTAVNACLGVVTAAAMYLLGMPNPVLWGVVAGVLNFVPYFGALVTIGVLGLVAVLTFDDPWRMLLPPATFFMLTALEGQVVSPILHGRRLALNPVVIFVGLLLWGWLWGIPGILLAVPLLATLKIFCDNIEPLAPIGEFLDDQR